MADQAEQTTQKTLLESINRATLTPLVRRVLKREHGEITDWTHHPLQGGAGDRGAGTSSVYRFTGMARDGDEMVTWSLILKAIAGAAQGRDPQGGVREASAYQSGALSTFSGNFIAAECFEVAEHPGDVYSLWLEDVIDEGERPWSLPRFATTARHLGQFNGAYLAGTSLPDWPWLSRDWFRTVTAPAAGSVIDQLRDPAVLAHPRAGRLFPTDVAAGLVRIWAERERFLAVLDRLPQTLCHGDAFPRNLFLRGAGTDHEQTVAIDWAKTGLRAIGAELTSLVQGSLFFNEFDLANAADLDQVVFDSYLTGLNDSGWQGDPRVVRLGYTAWSALRRLPTRLDLTLNADAPKIGWVERTWGLPFESQLDLIANGRRFVLGLADEARALMEVVG